MKSGRKILLVDDDRVDVMTVKRALKELKIVNPVTTAGNGIEALEILRGSNEARPGLILLDLNMPKMGGIEFLQEIKNDNILKKIPVVILTTSSEDRDKVASFNLGVAGYMVKPVDYLQFVELIRTIDIYWSLSEISH